MESSRNKPVQVHLVTPEEPDRLRDNYVVDSTNSSSSISFHNDKDKDKDTHNGNGNGNGNGNDNNKGETDFGGAKDCFMSSIRNTRKLETEISIMIQYLKSHRDDNTQIDREHMINLLNRSLTSISHWSLQAQLAHLKATDDDRHIVENNLLRKEMEVLTSRGRSNELSSPHKSMKVKRPSISISTSKQPSAPSKNGYQGLTSPTTPRKKAVRSPFKKQLPTASIPLDSIVDPLSLKLVESKKPHPRMRRTSDNPMTNEYVRVFHLQRK